MPQHSVACDSAVRAFTVGLSGTRGSGRATLLLSLCRLLRDSYSLAVITTHAPPGQDSCRDFLVRHKALAPARVTVVSNLQEPGSALEALAAEFRPDLVFLDCDGDDSDVADPHADYTIHVVDGSAEGVSPYDTAGVASADLLVLNQTRLGPSLDAQRTTLVRECLQLRGDASAVFTQARYGIGTIEVARLFLESWRRISAPELWNTRIEARPALTQV
jgi:urease accessory protein